MVSIDPGGSFLRRRATKTSMVFRIAVELLRIDVIDQVTARDGLSLVMHQVGKDRSS